jgi:MFS family permease
MNGVMIAIGYAIASYMGLAFFYSTNISAQWRGPLGLALVWPILLLIVICFVPESPRWLLMKGRTEEAWKVVSELHNNPNDPDQEYARGEFYQMQKQTEMDKTLNPTWKQMFVKPSYRKRTIMAIVFAFVGQSTAILVVNNYVSIRPTLYTMANISPRVRHSTKPSASEPATNSSYNAAGLPAPSPQTLSEPGSWTALAVGP